MPKQASDIEAKVVTFSVTLGPDAEAVTSTGQDAAWCPTTRFLRGLGVPELINAVRERRPQKNDLAVHVAQRSQLLGPQDTIGTLKAIVSLEQEQKETLTIHAEFSQIDDVPVARSISTIAFVDPLVLNKKSRVGRARTMHVDDVHLSFSKDDIHRYCAASGDDNPIHHDAAFARSQGLRAVTVPGALLLQSVEGLLNVRGAINMVALIEAQFIDIIEADETVVIETRKVRSASEDVLRFKMIKADGRIALLGAAIEAR